VGDGTRFDRITLGALILALGLLVDDAIIAIEMMVVKMEEGYDRIRASAYAWSHTAAPMLAGTLVTVIGLMPVGFAKSTAGEYAGNIFWVVGFALIASWFVAVIFTPYMGVKLLPAIKPVEGGHAAIYQTPRYQQVRGVIAGRCGARNWWPGRPWGVFGGGRGYGAGEEAVLPHLRPARIAGRGADAQGTAIGQTSEAARQVETWLRQQPESRIVTTYVGRRASMSRSRPNCPILPSPRSSCAPARRPTAMPETAPASGGGQWSGPGGAGAGDAIGVRPAFAFPRGLPRQRAGSCHGARIAAQVQAVMQADPMMRTVNADWGDRVPALHFVLDQDRLQALGLTSGDVANQLQFLLTGVTVSQAREDIRTVDVVARSAGGERLDPARIGDYTLVGAHGQRVPVSQIGKIEVRMEDPILQRRDRVPTITVRGDIADGLQPPMSPPRCWPNCNRSSRACPPGIASTWPVRLKRPPRPMPRWRRSFRS
jgi:multidrug efflux pump subunit AcrB